MRFYDRNECEAWLTDRGRSKPDAQSGLLSYETRYPREFGKFYVIARWIARATAFRQAVFLWITEWGVFSSSENWHLYYRLRQSYGDYRLLDEAPGHLFLEHEVEDLASFLQLAMLNGWGGYVLTQADYMNTFFSHDEFIKFYSADQRLIDEACKKMETSG
jgi:hypothetical protein